MRKSTETALQQLTSRLHEQALQVATHGATLNVQFQRIANMQLQLDQPPLARKAEAANAKATTGHGDPAERISG